MGKEYTEAQKRATEKYMEGRKTIRVIVTDAEHEQIKARAAGLKMSMSNYIKELISGDERPRGEWVKEIGDIHSSGEFFYCSNCGESTFIPSKRILSTTNFKHFEKPSFCPKCGADMRKGAE